MIKVALVNSTKHIQKKPRRTQRTSNRARFSRLVRHPATKWIGPI